ncbi:MAG: EamA family transporter [Bacteroidales bacterium]|nr:EamA family transporter [Bacteroidales bacterium]
MLKSKKAYLYAGLAILFWGTSASAFKIGLRYLDHYQLLFIASFTSTVFLFGIILFQKKNWKIKQIKRKELLRTTLLGFLNPFLYYVILFKAYDLLPAQVAQPLNFIWPITLVLLSIPILKQRLTTKGILALIISFVGVFLISSEGNITNMNFANPLGVVLALGSSVVWALFWLFNMKNKGDEIVQLFLNFLTAFILIGITTLLFSDVKITSTNGILSGIYIGLFEMGITFVVWLKALKLSERTDKISNLIYLTPFCSLVFISIFLHEKIFITTFFGLILIILGIFIQQSKKIKI